MATGKNWLRIAVEDFLESGFLSNAMFGGLKFLTNEIEEEAREAFVYQLLDLADQSDTVPAAKKIIRDALLQKKPAILMAIIGAGIALGMALVQSILNPVFTNFSYLLAKQQKHARLDPASAIRANWRNPAAYARLRAALADLGYEELQLDALEDINQPRIPEVDLIRRAYRNKSALPEVFNELERRGWKTEDIDALFHTLRPTPSPQDLVRFNLRDIYNPQIVEKWGFREDLTSEFLDEMEKTGMDRHYAEQYHMAGWEVPSPQLGFEMLHRLDGREGRPLFTMDDLDNVLKTADYSPFARELLKAIAYQNPTRVDIRRMRELGVIDDAQMHYYHRALGYDETIASELDEFVLKDIADNSKGRTKESIVRAYRLGVYTRSEAKEALIAITGDEDDAEFLLALEDAAQQEKLQNEQLDVIEYFYVENQISAPEAHNRMDSINIASDRKDQLIELWDVKRQKRQKFLTKSEIEDALERDFIPESDVQIKVENLGYHPDDAAIIIKIVLEKAAEDRARKLEAAAKELDRLQRASLRDEYAILNAEIEVQIKELQRDAADLKLAIYETEDEDQQAQMRDELVEIPPQIAALRLEKAQARRSTLPPRS